MPVNLSVPALFFALALPLAAEEATATYQQRIEPLLERYCYDCHGDGAHKGDFRMDDHADTASLVADRTHWLRIWTNVRSQIMPPEDEDQPESAEQKEILDWIEGSVFQLDPAKPDPGRVVIRRLNRAEYRHAVLDLLGVEYDTSAHFPPDDASYGFDNIGEVLTVSPMLMEKYLAAAEEIAERALPRDPAAFLPAVLRPAADFLHPDGPDPGWIPFTTAAHLQVAQEIQWEGEYELTLEFSTEGAVEATLAAGGLGLLVDGKKIADATIGWDQRAAIHVTGKVPLTAGSHALEISFEPSRQAAPTEEELFLNLHHVTIRGPLGGGHRQAPPGHQALFPMGPPPEDPNARETFTRELVTRLASRAFRRPLDEATRERLVNVVNETTARLSYEDGLRQLIEICLCSPRFLFRAEALPGGDEAEQVVPLDEFALASRLSFFLWNSLPDVELLDLAAKGSLRSNLKTQVDRMLADPKSARLVEDFVGQWLQVRNLPNAQISATTILGVDTKREASQQFDPRLRADMRRETEMLFDFVLRQNRPIEEIVSARYSFLNERLARFYGIGGVNGPDFRPVDLSEHPERGGILTQGTFLIVTSNPTRTSLVKRGLYVLENILGTPPPPQPANVPSLESTTVAGIENPTQRQMLEIHRKRTECRGCHVRMDPIGIGLENFDALGRYRTTELGQPIDSSGKLVTGEHFSDVSQLKKLIAGERKIDFYRCFVEKLLTYSVGRGFDIYDVPTIDALVERLYANQGSLRDLIHGIVESTPFDKRRGGA